MATQRQIDANRRNGARSKGPVTPEGKANSSRNSTTHGLSSRKIFVLANESPDIFDGLVAAFVRHYQPANEYEHELCLNIAHAHWRIRRLAIVETGLFDREMARQQKSINQTPGGADECVRLAAAFEGLARESGALGLLTRYEGRLQRTLRSLIERLEAAQKKRQNEPNLSGPPAVKPPAPQPQTELSIVRAPAAAPAAPAPASALSVLPLRPPGPLFFECNPSLAERQKGAKLDSQQF
jgi:hypothetical protein